MTHPWQPANDRRPYWEDGLRWGRAADGEIAVGLLRWLRADGNTENRWFVLFRRLGEDHVFFQPVLSQTIITSSPGSTQTITSDATWNNSNNFVEVLAGGSSGNSAAATSRSGGGGGAYTRILNFPFATPGTTQATLEVGAGGASVTGNSTGSAGGDSWFNATVFPTTGNAAGAKGATACTSTTAGLGGLSSGAYAVPATGAITNSGGDGLHSSTFPEGGGAAGPNGAGGTCTSTTTGSADGGTVPGRTTTGVGASGMEFDSAHGCGAGSAGSAQTGGLYGGGAGAATAANPSGAGAQGIVVLNWTPAFTPGGFFVDLSAELASYIIRSVRALPYR